MRLEARVFLLALLLSAPHQVMSQASVADSLYGADSSNDPRLQDLESTLGLAGLTADHIIILDLSGSMDWKTIPGSRQRANSGQSRFDLVLGNLPILLQAIPANDFVQVIGFHGQVEDRILSLLHTCWQPTSVGLLINAIRDTFDPPDGQNTDIGQALEAAYEIAQSRGMASEILYVYFFTDGENDPEASSAYDVDATNQNWSVLRQEWQTLLCGKTAAQIFLFGLFDVSSKGVLDSVFTADQLQLIPITSPGDLEGLFGQIVARRRYDLVENVLLREQELGPWSIAISTQLASDIIGRPCIEVSVASQYLHASSSSCLTVSVTAAGLEASNASYSLDHVLPGESRSLLVPIGKAVDSPFFRRTIASSLHIAAQLDTVHLEPREEISECFRPSLAAIEGSSPVSSQVDYTYTTGRFGRWILAIPIVLILAAACLAFWKRPRTVTATIFDSEKCETARIGPTRHLQIGSPAIAQIVARPKGPRGSRFMITAMAVDLTINGRPARPGKEIEVWPVAYIRTSEGKEYQLRELR